MALEKDKISSSPLKLTLKNAEYFFNENVGETHRVIMKDNLESGKSQDLYKEAEKLHSLGLSARREENFELAIEYYTKSLKLYPNNFKALFNRGFAYDKIHEFDLAIEDYTKSLEIEPTNAYALYNKGISLDKKGLFEEAINNFTMAITLRSDKADFYHNRGFTYRKKNDYHNAISDYSQAILLCPQYFKVLQINMQNMK